MEIKADVTISFPRERVYLAYRDRLEELAEYLPNIRSIVVQKKEPRLNGVYLVNEWTGGGDIPSVARAFLSESMLKWTDLATWKDDEHAVEWKTEVHAFPGAMKSSGKNRFVEIAGGTKVEIRGDLSCDASKIPGVPRLMAKTVAGAVEKLFVGKIAENLVAVGRGVEKMLEKEGR